MAGEVDLSQVRVVLMYTSHPGNIGAVARAMKNMGLSQLYLVKPDLFPHSMATSRASGADDLLASAIVVETLDEALADCCFVVGASARLRSISWPVHNPRESAERMLEAAEEGPVALVMGREQSGLSNAELERCNYLVNIPANPEYSSLNLAAATQVLAYELRMAALARLEIKKIANKKDYRLATAAEVEGLYEHFEVALTDIKFLNPASPRKLMRRLRRLFNRTQLDEMEVNILRGILSAAQGQKYHYENEDKS
ncbi:MAG: RNA methyltransferase [Gammaproteobacteria bacterium]|nr:RNA methyltransferase [Gammaproteobacteria bacterium]